MLPFSLQVRQHCGSTAPALFQHCGSTAPVLRQHCALGWCVARFVRAQNRAPLSRIRALGNSSAFWGLLVPSWGSPGAVLPDPESCTPMRHLFWRCPESYTPVEDSGLRPPPEASLGFPVRLLAPSGASWRLLEPTGALPLGPPGALWGLLGPPEFFTVFTQIRMEPFRRHVSGSSCTFRSPYYL